MRRFAAELRITAETRVLDVGGTPDCWRLLPVMPRVTLLNTPRAKDDLGGLEQWVAGDGRALPFRDGAFDVVFSNSVIEHVGDASSQRDFAAEIARVGRAYWVQTPNRWFPIEQHLMTPFLHWLPQRWQRRLVRFNLWRLLVRTTPGQKQYYVDHYLGEIRLLSAAQLQELFPGARITRERFIGWTKSLLAVGHGFGSVGKSQSTGQALSPDKVSERCSPGSGLPPGPELRQRGSPTPPHRKAD